MGISIDLREIGDVINTYDYFYSFNLETHAPLRLTWQCTMNSNVRLKSLASSERFMSQRRMY